MAYRYYNTHPKGLHTDDCVKRAIATVTGIPYMEVQRQLNNYKKVTGAKYFNSHRNPHRYVEDILGARKIPVAKNTKAKDFCQTHPKGRFILDMKAHWSAVIDGDLYDTFNCEYEAVNFAYEITCYDKSKQIDVKKQVLRYCCTVENFSDSESWIFIYDGNGVSVKRKVPTELCGGYIRCLEDEGYTYVG